MVHFDLDTEVRRDGAPVPRGQALTVSEPATFTLGELGTVTVRPGGESIADSARQVQALRRELQQQLALLGATSLDEAERAAAERQELLQQAASQQELLKAHAPGGVATLDAEIARLESELEQLAAAPVADGVDLAELTRQLQAARAELQATEAAAAAAASELKAAQDQQAAAQRRLVELQAQLAAQQGELRRRQSLLAEARSREPDEELASALAVADAAAKAAAEELEQARRELAAAEPERLELELSMARDAYASIKKRYAELQRSARDLQIELQSLGQTGLGERRQELQGQLEQARLQAERLEREAQSLRLLREVLEDCARQASAAFLAPVLKRVQPYLRLLMPEAELLLDNELQLVDEAFDDLSIGTREQLAVITRLAFADLLHERGQPVAVVMDDALVYADDQRFQSMKLILHRAAQRYQVLILTCRERDYLDLGAPIIRLADCRELAAAPA
mgnify:CR=1 FL=1